MNALDLMVGTEVLYHDHLLDPYQRARAARVVGPGAIKGTVNLCIWSDPTLDVHAAPMIFRKNVKVYALYPEFWPDTGFAVLPVTACDHLDPDALTYPQFIVGQLVVSLDLQVQLARAEPQTEPKSTDHQDNGQAHDSTTEPEKPEPTPPRTQGKPQSEAEKTKPERDPNAPPPVHVDSIRADMIGRLLRDPFTVDAFADRKLQIGRDGANLAIRPGKEGREDLVLCTIEYVIEDQDTHAGGYLLKAHKTGGALVKVGQIVRPVDDAGELMLESLIGMAAVIASEGENAKTIAEAVKAYKSAIKRDSFAGFLRRTTINASTHAA